MKMTDKRTDAKGPYTACGPAAGLMKKSAACLLILLIPVLMMTGCRRPAGETAGSEPVHTSETESIEGSEPVYTSETESIAENEGSYIGGTDDTAVYEAVFLGVENYGAEATNKDNKDDFSYRFKTDGGEMIFRIDNGTKNEEGKYDYPIQNILKEKRPSCLRYREHRGKRHSQTS